MPDVLHMPTPAFLGGRSLHPAQRIGAALHYGLPVRAAPIGGPGAIESGLYAPPMNLAPPPVLTPAIQGAFFTRDGSHHI